MNFHCAHSNSQLDRQFSKWFFTFWLLLGEATTLVQWVCIVNQFLVETEAEIGEPASRAAKCHQPGPEHVAETSTIEAKAQTKTSAPRMWLKEHLNLGLAA